MTIRFRRQRRTLHLGGCCRRKITFRSPKTSGYFIYKKSRRMCNQPSLENFLQNESLKECKKYIRRLRYLRCCHLRRRF